MPVVASCAFPPLVPRTNYGALSLNGVLMHRGAWNVVNVEELWIGGQTTRGGDRILPGFGGVLSYPRIQTATSRTLLLLVSGAVDLSGAVSSDAVSQLAANLDYLKVNVTNPQAAVDAGSLDGTITADIAMPDASTRSGVVTIESFVRGDVFKAVTACTIDLTIPVNGIL